MAKTVNHHMFTWVPYPDNAQEVLLAMCFFDLAFFCYCLFDYLFEPVFLWVEEENSGMHSTHSREPQSAYVVEHAGCIAGLHAGTTPTRVCAIYAIHGARPIPCDCLIYTVGGRGLGM